MESARSRLETQGYVGVGASSLVDMQFGLRFSPALCAVGVAAGTALASPTVLLVMMATAVLGAATPRHPFDWIYNYGVRHLLRKPAIPRNAAPRRFSCAVGAAWLLLTAGAFAAGWVAVGTVLGAAMALMAAFVAATHICLPSLVYTRLFGRVGEVPQISPEDAFDRLRNGAVLLDLRDQDFWVAGHIPGARRVAMEQLPGACTAVDADATVLVVCQGGVASLTAAKVLRDAGYAGACSVRGGMAS